MVAWTGIEHFLGRFDPPPVSLCDEPEDSVIGSSSSGVRRDLGESSVRRSRSPATRPAIGRSLSSKAVRSLLGSPHWAKTTERDQRTRKMTEDIIAFHAHVEFLQAQVFCGIL
ncbi:hypothetical protein NE237_027973 [Protea cynaroides]|uniref:Uncharacterized protein n=1 Tax=Protea cynaroides TaxID=273540 RepID=A0A9Q0GNI7_9MAGN|nr:hypothetical protein NE237_027973 [Protea cynaroides]